MEGQVVAWGESLEGMLVQSSPQRPGLLPGRDKTIICNSIQQIQYCTHMETKVLPHNQSEALLTKQSTRSTLQIITNLAINSTVMA